MDLYLDRLLKLPNTTVESFTEEENKITLNWRNFIKGIIATTLMAAKQKHLAVKFLQEN